MQIQQVTELIYTDSTGSAISAKVKFLEFSEVHPFMASPDDPEAHGREIYARAVAGEFGPIAPYVAPPPPPVVVPQQVTMRQARLALLGAGLLPQVHAAIASLPSPQKEAAEIEWEYAAVVQRNSGLVPTLGAALGMTETQLDELFTAAAAL